jgi:hypothetical protein
MIRLVVALVVCLVCSLVLAWAAATGFFLWRATPSPPNTLELTFATGSVAGQAYYAQVLSAAEGALQRAAPASSARLGMTDPWPAPGSVWLVQIEVPNVANKAQIEEAQQRILRALLVAFPHGEMVGAFWRGGFRLAPGWLYRNVESAFWVGCLALSLLALWGALAAGKRLIAVSRRAPNSPLGPGGEGSGPV